MDSVNTLTQITISLFQKSHIIAILSLPLYATLGHEHIRGIKMLCEMNKSRKDTQGY